MYICLCNGVTDTQIKQAVYEGTDSLKQLRGKMDIANNCCKCVQATRDVIRTAKHEMNMYELAKPA